MQPTSHGNSRVPVIGKVEVSKKQSINTDYESLLKEEEDDDNFNIDNILNESYASRSVADRFYSFCHVCAGGDNGKATNTQLALTAVEVALAIPFNFYFQYFIHDPFCNMLFKCGCVWVFAGGWKNCNYFNSEGLPKCPWCASRWYVSWTTDYLVFALMIVTYFIFLYNRKRFNILWRYIAPMVVYFAVGSLVGLIFKLATGYPTYFINW
jgi:hypothetical protein